LVGGSVDPWTNQRNSLTKSRSLSSFLDEVCESKRGRWYADAYYRSDEGDDTENIGLHGWLCGYVNYIGREEGTLSAFRFAGGAGDFFTRALASLSAKPKYRCVLKSVEQSGSEVTLSFDDGSFYRCDRALIAIPPKCLKDIQFSPPLSNEMQAGLTSIGMGRIVKAALQFSDPFWESHGWNGSLLFDSPAQQTWLGSLGSKFVLMAYVCGSDTKQLQTADDPVKKILTELARVFPEASGCFLGGHCYDWTHHTYSKGGFSHIPPGMNLRELRALREPHGLVHFAGEHTANWLGFIEGALESAERAVDELLA
jgi:monoamine oxidase